MAAATLLARSSIFPKGIGGMTGAVGEEEVVSSIYWVCLLQRRRRRSTSNGFHDLGRQAEPHVLRHHFNFFHVTEPLADQKLYYFLYQALGGRGTCRKGNRMGALQPFRPDISKRID